MAGGLVKTASLDVLMSVTAVRDRHSSTTSQPPISFSPVGLMRGWVYFPGSFLFIFVGSTAGMCVMLLTPFFGDDEATGFAILLSIIAIQLILFGTIGEALGGASFNPTGNLANFIIGVGNESIAGLGIRVPAQLAGSVFGAWALVAIMPQQYQHTLGGPRLGPGIDMWTGALAELLLTFAVTMVVLYAIFGGPKSFLTRTSILITGVLSVIVIGAPYSGPAMNPALAFAWAYLNDKHSTTEHLLVYWAAPIVGTFLAAIVFAAFVKPSAEKPDGAVAKETKEAKTRKEPKKTKEAKTMSKKTEVEKED